MSNKKEISNRMKRKTLFSIIFFLVFVFVCSFLTTDAYQYKPMESIPGFEGQNPDGDFPTFISNLYSFAIWTVGIAALLMVFIGGYMYFMAAGNQGKVDTAKKIITDALIGVVLAFSAWLLLYIINPDLVNVELRSLDVVNVKKIEESTSNQNGDASNPTTQSNCQGSCTDVTTNAKGTYIWNNGLCLCIPKT